MPETLEKNPKTERELELAPEGSSLEDINKSFKTARKDVSATTEQTLETNEQILEEVGDKLTPEEEAELEGFRKAAEQAEKEFQIQAEEAQRVAEQEMERDMRPRAKRLPAMVELEKEMAKELDEGLGLAEEGSTAEEAAEAGRKKTKAKKEAATAEPVDEDWEALKNPLTPEEAAEAPPANIEAELHKAVSKGFAERKGGLSGEETQKIDVGETDSEAEFRKKVAEQADEEEGGTMNAEDMVKEAESLTDEDVAETENGIDREKFAAEVDAEADEKAEEMEEIAEKAAEQIAENKREYAVSALSGVLMMKDELLSLQDAYDRTSSPEDKNRLNQKRKDILNQAADVLEEFPEFRKGEELELIADTIIDSKAIRQPNLLKEFTEAMVEGKAKKMIKILRKQAENIQVDKSAEKEQEAEKKPKSSGPGRLRKAAGSIRQAVLPDAESDWTNVEPKAEHQPKSIGERLEKLWNWIWKG